jgi:hypothetical protein
LAGVRRVGIVDVTIVNLKEVEDQAPKFGLSPNVESRFATVPLQRYSHWLILRPIAGVGEPACCVFCRDGRQSSP